jgi:hypothetical protein
LSLCHRSKMSRHETRNSAHFHDHRANRSEVESEPHVCRPVGARRVDTINLADELVPIEALASMGSRAARHQKRFSKLIWTRNRQTLGMQVA